MLVNEYSNLVKSRMIIRVLSGKGQVATTNAILQLRKENLTMAGRQQHFIPKQFLRGFLANSKKEQTWYYRRGNKSPIINSIQNIAQQRDFYSSPSLDFISLDDEITAYEDTLVSKISSIRATKVGEIVDQDAAAEIVCHLAIRAAYLREVFTVGIDKLFVQLSDVIGSEDSFRDFAGLGEGPLNSILADSLEAEIGKLDIVNLMGLPKPVIARISIFMLRENLPDIYKDDLVPAWEGLKGLRDALPSSIVDAHNKALATDFVPEDHIGQLSQLDWKIVNAPSEGLIMPDCLVVSKNHIDAEWQSYYMESENRAIVAMPVSSSKLLLGIAKGQDFDGLNIDQINFAMAKNSSNFFIADTSNHQMYMYTLGEQLDSDLVRIVEESLTHTNSGDPCLVSNDSEPEETVRTPESQRKWQLTLQGFGDKQVADNLTNIVGTVVECCDAFPPDHLIFTANFSKTINEIEGLSVAQQSDENLAVGKAIRSRDKDGLAITVVLDFSIAGSLLSEDKRFGLGVLLNFLATTKLDRLVHSCFPKFFGSEGLWDFDGTLSYYVGGAFADYYGATWSGGLLDDSQQFYRDQLLEKMNAIKPRVWSALVGHQSDLDFSKLLSSVGSEVSEVLSLACKFLGSLEATGISLEEDFELKVTMSEYGLKNWLAILQSDLAQMQASIGRWKDLSELQKLNIHLERLLWACGIVVEKLSDGQMYIYPAKVE